MTVDNVYSSNFSCQSTTQNPFKQSFEDFKDLGQAVKSGDTTDAQSALAAFQKDLAAASPDSRLGKLFADGTPASQDLQSLQDALQSNDPTGAQTAMDALKKNLQGTQKAHGHHHHHHHVDNDGDAADSSSSSATTPSTASSKADSSLDLLA